MPQDPSQWAARVLARHGVENLLDAGPMKTRFGAGELVVNAEGLLLIDSGTASILEASWEQIREQSEPHHGLVRLEVEVEAYGLLQVTIPERLGANITALRALHAPASVPEQQTDGWAWQHAPLFVTDEKSGEIDSTSSVILRSAMAGGRPAQSKRSPLLIGALVIVGLVIGFGVVSQLGSDPTPQADPSVQVAGATTTPGVVTTAGIACHENYETCVPIAEDVDCEGGQGDGPLYVKGPIKVLGFDVYRLDTDGDGIACGPSDKPEDEVFDGN